MPILEILKVELKSTNSGKKLKNCMIEVEGRQYPYKKVTVWENHPEFDKIVPGYKITGGSRIDGKDSGTPNPKAPGKNYMNYTLVVDDQNSPQTSQNAPGDVQTDKLMHSKLDSIYSIIKAMAIHMNVPGIVAKDARDELHATIKEDSSNMANFDDIPNPEDFPF